jgi:SAM-dependent methyltransferase
LSGIRNPPANARGGYDTDLFRRMVEVEDISFWFRARNRLIVQLVSGITNPGDRLLEIGCGTGYVLQALTCECGLKATGSELYAEGLEHARRRVPDADFIELDARSMPYERAFDLVAAFDVLEHIDDDLATLRGLYRATRQGGFLIATVPQHRWLWSNADTVARHVRRYRRVELVDRVTQAGFTVVRVTSFVMMLLPLMAGSRWCEKLSERKYDPIAELAPPAAINSIFERALEFERMIIKYGVNLPVGGSLVLVARRDH